MRLIDADEVRKYIAFDGDILIDEMPTIEAIPVSYIQKRANTYYSKAYKNALNTIIRDWQEDKELKNNE